jgi:7-cyano-7-deazaguanine reductase
MSTINPDIPLGKKVIHSQKYDPKQLFAVGRADARQRLGIGTTLPFYGGDLWNAYEISWLNQKGKPCVAMARISFPITSVNIVESKSLKLYLNSFNQTRFASSDAVAHAMERDLCKVAMGAVAVSLVLPGQFHRSILTEPEGICLDHQDIRIDQYHLCPDYLVSGGPERTEKLFSNLLRTNCPVTGQPDWGTVVIGYTGPGIDHDGLLRYLVSFRDHTGFHENCIEQIFVDMTRRCHLKKLFVHAGFTRRGGIDINPLRASFPMVPKPERYARQ